VLILSYNLVTLAKKLRNARRNTSEGVYKEEKEKRNRNMRIRKRRKDTCIKNKRQGQVK